MDHELNQAFPNPEWLQVVADAIGSTPEVVYELIRTWVFLDKTKEQMQERLTYLAFFNGKVLVFAGNNPS